MSLNQSVQRQLMRENEIMEIGQFLNDLRSHMKMKMKSSK